MAEEPKVVELLEQLPLSHPLTLTTTVSMASLWFLAAMPVLSPAFLAPDDNNTNNIGDFISVQIEFNLESTDNSLHPAELTTSMYFLGNLLLGQIPCILADKYGRRPVIVFSVFTTGLAGVLASVSPTFCILLILRFIQGIAFSALLMTNWVLCCESLAPSWHKVAAVMFGSFWVADICFLLHTQSQSSGYIGMTPIAKWSTSWRQIQFFGSCPSLVFSIFLLCKLPESPAFLATKGRAVELKRFLSRANQNIVEPIKCNVEETIGQLSEKGKENLTDTVRDIFVSRETLLHLGAQVVIWICDFLMYGTMSLTATGVGKDPYVSFMFSGLVELPCYIVIPYLLDWLGRRRCVVMVHLLSALSFSLLLLYPQGSSNPNLSTPSDSPLWIYFWLLGKFGVSSAFQCCFIYGVEIFPVEKRNICLGICSTLANLGAFLSPHVDILDEVYPGGSFSTFFVLCLLCSACTTVLPETGPRYRKQRVP